MTRIFHWLFYVNDGSHVRLWHPSCVYITAQRQYKRCVHFWNNFPCHAPYTFRVYFAYIMLWNFTCKIDNFSEFSDWFHNSGFGGKYMSWRFCSGLIGGRMPGSWSRSLLRNECAWRQARCISEQFSYFNPLSR